MDKPITRDEALTLARYIRDHGPRDWKNDLRASWQDGRYEVEDDDDVPILQTIRNQRGPSWLSRQTTADIEARAVAFREGNQ